MWQKAMEMHLGNWLGYRRRSDWSETLKTSTRDVDAKDWVDDKKSRHMKLNYRKGSIEDRHNK